MAKQTFTVGQVLTAAQMTSLQQTAMGGGSATAKTASYTLVAADAGSTVIMNSASATTITVNTALFAAGDTVLIVNQGAGVCTITAGTATVSTAGSLALSQNETGQLYFLSTSASIFADYTQASSSPKVLQVLSTTKTDTFTLASSTFTDITGLSVSITPSSATNKIMVFMNVIGNGAPGSGWGGLRIMRDSTAICVGDTPGSRVAVSGFMYVNDATLLASTSNSVLDSPATTSATTYKVQFMTNSAGTGYINRTQTDTNNNSFARAASTITVMEISA